MKRLRIGMQGVILGIRPFRVTPVALNIDADDIDAWLKVQKVLHGATCSVTWLLKATWFVELEDV